MYIDEFFAEFCPWYQNVPDQLAQIRQLFGPENLSIHFFEDLAANPHQIYRDTLQFLGVDPDFSPEFAKFNSSIATPRSGLAQSIVSAMHSQFAMRLRRRFCDHEIGISAAISGLLSRPRQELDTQQKQRYIQAMQPSINKLSIATGRDLSSWL